MLVQTPATSEITNPFIESTDTRPLTVIFPLRVLRPDASLLQPRNTETTYEYYLLENLGAGLVRDDTESASGYEGLIAERWTQTEPSTWVFRIKPDFKWSDGSILTGEQLVAHFEALKRNKGRHLVNLAKLSRVHFDAGERALTLHFSEKTNSSVLHELSLADAVLIHSCGDWSITSGPYSVGDYRPAERFLKLRANPHSPLLAKAAPRTVVLRDVVDYAQLGSAFTTMGADIYPLPVLYFANRYAAIREAAPAKKVGRSTLLYFFQMNARNPATQILDSRRLLAALIAEAFRNFRLGEDFAYYDQLVPFGYRGSLRKYEAPVLKRPHASFKKTHFVLNFPAAFRDLSSPLERLRVLAKKHGVSFEYRFTAFDDVEAGADEFARISPFKGNQKDPVGSWSFLFSDKTGALSPFREKGLPLLNEALIAASDREKSEALSRLHRYVLDNALLIPVLIQREQVLASQRVNLDRWNPFDLRLRFYEIAWK